LLEAAVLPGDDDLGPAFAPDASAALGGAIASVEELVMGDAGGSGASPFVTSTVTSATRVLAQ